MRSTKVALMVLFMVGAVPAFAAQNASPSPTPKSGEAPKRPTKMRVSLGVSEGLLVHKVRPKYPREAKKKHIKGDVFLRINIDTQGNVTDALVMKGDPVLVGAAINAVKQWKYKPYLLDWEPIEVETIAVVTFK